MKFNYQARDQKGEIRAGQIEASSKEAGLALLQKYGFYITYLEPVEAPIYAKKIKLFEGISQKDIVLFSRQLSIMFRSQVPLVESLNALSGQTKNSDFKEKILKLAEDIEGGMPFSKALSRYPKIFSPFYVAMIKSGEVSGKLSEVLSYLAEHLEREYHLAGKIKGVMVYPAMIIIVVFSVLSLMVFFVIPNLAKVLETSDEALPLITQIVLGFTTFLKDWGWLMFLILIGLGFLSIRYYLTPKGRKFFDKFFLRLPLIGSLLEMIYLNRFAENFSTLISGGLPVTQALETVGDIIGNTAYKEVISETTEEVRRGETISSVLSCRPELFPSVFIQMVMVGEKTGTLDSSLMNIVDFYQKEIDRAIDNTLTILEPALIVFLGLVVGLLILSVMLPLYKMMSV